MDLSTQGVLITRIAGLAALVLLIVGAIVVLRPFVAAGLFAAVFVLATWPLYALLRRAVGGRNTLAASIATLLIIVLVVLPFAWLVQNAIDRVPGWFAVARGWIIDGLPPPPAWLQRIPLAGVLLHDYWQDFSSDPGALRDLGKRAFAVGREPLVGAGAVIGEGILQLVLANFISFFFYRDGEAIIRSLHAGVARLAGPLADELIATVEATVRGVVLGIVGTAVAQGAVATVGFLIAGIPGALVLGGITALVSIIPGGPVLVWLGATVWLLSQEQLGWALFMAIWGVAVISSIDNVVRPLLISRGASLSFALVFIGVIGGIIAFGFVGIFIGPTLLALAWRLWRTFTGQDAAAIPTATNDGANAGAGSIAERR